MTDTQLAPIDIDSDTPDHAHILADSSIESVDWMIANRIRAVALCGFEWTPSSHGAELPVCEECLKIAAEAMS